MNTTTAPSTPVRPTEETMNYLHPPSPPRKHEVALTQNTNKMLWMDLSFPSSFFDNIMSDDSDDSDDWLLQDPRKQQRCVERSSDKGGAAGTSYVLHKRPRLQPKWSKPSAKSPLLFTPGPQEQPEDVSDGPATSFYSSIARTITTSSSADSSEGVVVGPTMTPEPTIIRPILIEDDDDDSTDGGERTVAHNEIFRFCPDEQQQVGDYPCPAAAESRDDIAMLQESWDDLEMHDENINNISICLQPQPRSPPLLPRISLQPRASPLAEPPSMDWF